MKIQYIIILFLLSFSSLQSQNSKTVLEELKRGKTLQLEWVHQQFLSDRTVIPNDFPLFPDQLKEGEGEAFIGLELKMEDCKLPPCRIKVRVKYVSSVEFPERKLFDSNLNIFLPTTPPNASLFPKIEDTRYLSYERKTPAFSLENLDSISLLVDMEKGLVDTSWVGYYEHSNEMPSTFSHYYLKVFLKTLWQQKWLEKEHFQLVKKEQQFGKTSVHFFRPIHPAKRTIITGKILSPVTNEIEIAALKQGSWIRTWGRETFKLDANNQFKIEVNLDAPSKFGLSHGFNGLMLYIEPGDSLHINIDANAFYRKTNFSGDAAMVNQFILDFYHQVRGDNIYHLFDQDLLKQSQLDFLKKVQEKEQKELAFIENYPKKLNPAFINNFAQFIRLETASSLWYNLGFFYKNKDAKIEPAAIDIAQQARKYFFRLPADKEYDFELESYLEFQKILLQGKYVNQDFPFRSTQNYDFAKMILSPKNVHRIGRLYLFLQRDDPALSYEKLLNEVRSRCLDEYELKLLEDYKNPLPNNSEPSFSRAFPVGRQAPFWRFENGNKDSIQLADYRGRYLLLHIGLAENLPQALNDIENIQKENSQNFEAISIVMADDIDRINVNEKDIIYLPFSEMKILRDSYLIDNNANHFFIIDPGGKVVSNPFYTSSFKKLKSIIKNLPSENQRPYWKPSKYFWRNLGLFSLLLLIISAVLFQRKRILAKREKQRRQLLELELKGIRAQMNPHFLFNALSSIQNLIRKKDEVGADRYLTQFAGLVRKILHHSEQEFITLAEEVAALKQYCSLEALRTPFEYEIALSDEIDIHNTYIPSMLLQPLIENAILHGLAPKTKNRQLWVTIKQQDEDLFCTITDNGIGINQAKLQTQKGTFKRKSYGLNLVRQRLQLLFNQPKKDFLEIIDRANQENETGTIIHLIIPTEK